MGDVIVKALDWIKAPRQSAIAFLAAVSLLLISDRMIASLGLTTFKQYRGFVALLAVLSGAAVTVESINVLWKHAMRKKKETELQKERHEYLLKLSPEEQGVLVHYIASTSDTRYHLMSDGNVGALIQEGILYISAQVGRLTPEGPLTAVNIQPWAKEYLSEHPDLLKDAHAPSSPPSAFRTKFGRG